MASIEEERANAIDELEKSLRKIIPAGIEDEVIIEFMDALSDYVERSFAEMKQSLSIF